LIEELLDEQPSYRKQIRIPAQEREQKQLLRSLMNIRQAAPITEEFEKIQDEYLQEENRRRGMVTLEELQEIQPELYVWQGDITTLQVGAIVNAANRGMTGCYQPCHSCIDNCIHTYAGIQLRNYCNDLMEAQGYEEPTGQAKITPAFNLPCEYVIHTVGPIVRGALTREHEQLLASCYESCLKIAAEHQVESIAFCCISTGVFMFPNERAAQIAVETVQRWKQENKSHIRVIFNVFKDLDKELYENLLGGRFVFREILPEEAEQAAAIEQICFPPNEACSAQMMKERVRKAPDFSSSQ
jgi:O-acetyl-ADP-ribose deacetylase (regulator of RNase III)